MLPYPPYWGRKPSGCTLYELARGGAARADPATSPADPHCWLQPHHPKGRCSSIHASMFTYIKGRYAAFSRLCLTYFSHLQHRLALQSQHLPQPYRQEPGSPRAGAGPPMAPASRGPSPEHPTRAGTSHPVWPSFMRMKRSCSLILASASSNITQ